MRRVLGVPDACLARTPPLPLRAGFREPSWHSDRDLRVEGSDRENASDRLEFPAVAYFDSSLQGQGGQPLVLGPHRLLPIFGGWF
jgi:hypothetical protein